MHRLLRYIPVLVLTGLLFGHSGIVAAAGGVAGSGELAVSEHGDHHHGGSHHEPGHDPSGHDPLHCLLFSCVPNLFIQSSAAQPLGAGRLVALVPPVGTDVLRPAEPERDPPIPRFPS
ncbi:MAG: hypothetical protein ACREH3_01000 [Geminicoccales bacterium]